MNFSISKVRIIGIVVAIVSALQIQAQTKKSGEIGIFAGGSYYLGELNKMPFNETKAAFGAFYRHTFDSRFSASGNFIYGHISGNTSKAFPTVDPFKSALYELNSQLEFNFWPFTPANKKTKCTPYVYAGCGLTYSEKAKIVLLTIPFGVGFKYNIYKNFMCGANIGMRKTFRDDLDYRYQDYMDAGALQKAYNGTKDWYSVFGVYLSYKIKYRQKCPAFD